MALVEDGALLGSRQLDMGNSGLDNQRLYPAVTAPVTGGKKPVCPKAHVDFAQDFISGCKKFLIIGTSGYDEDVIKLLGSSMGRSAIFPRVHFVSYAEKDDEGTWKPWERAKAEGAWTRFSEKVTGFQSAQLGIFYDGFRTYVSSDAFRTFAAA